MCKQKKELSAKERAAKEVKKKERRDTFNNYLSVKRTIATIFGAIGIILSIGGLGVVFYVIFEIVNGLKGIA